MSYRALLSNPLNSLFDYIDIPEGFFKAARDFDAAFQDSTSYPPFNILQTADNSFRIDIAVAGFKENELEIIKEGLILYINGNPAKDDKEPIQWIRRKLAKRSFRLQYTLGKGVNIEKVTLQDGILSIELIRTIPEELKPQRIAIENLSPKQLLE